MDLLQGTLDMLVLRTLVFGPLHGYGIAKAIRTSSNEALDIEFGSLYPALKRLEIKGAARFPNMAPEPSKSPPTRSFFITSLLSVSQVSDIVLEFRLGRILR